MRKAPSWAGTMGPSTPGTQSTSSCQEWEVCRETGGCTKNREGERMLYLSLEWVYDVGEAQRQRFYFPLPKRSLLRAAARSIPPSGKAKQPLIGSQMEQWRWINVNWIFLTLNKICIGMKLINRELSEGSLAHQCIRRQWYPSGRWWEEAGGKGILLAARWN